MSRSFMSSAEAQHSRDLRKQYREEIHEARKKKYDDPNLDMSIEKTEELFKKVKGPREAVYDSQLVNLQTDKVKEKTENIHINFLTLKLNEFAEKLFHQVGKKKRITRTEVTNDDVWSFLGTKSKAIFRSVPPVHFLHGTFEPGPIVLKKRQMRKRNVDTNDSEISRPRRVLFEDKDQESSQLKSVANKILGIFHQLYKNHQENAICYFEFVTDPNSFSETIENMFYVSLLIKNNNICLANDVEGLPALVPEGNHDLRSYKPVSENIISISMDDWKNIVQEFNIVQPMITPEAKKREEPKLCS